jgi:hypothetical protein
VGEAMAIGRNFTEALQKALRSLERPEAVFAWPADVDLADLMRSIRIPHDGRLREVQQALWAGASIDEVYEATGIDPWFLAQIEIVNDLADRIRAAESLDAALLRVAKRHGFSDAQIASLRGIPEREVRELRHGWGIRPVFKTVDTCAAEFAARTPYHYRNRAAKEPTPAMKAGTLAHCAILEPDALESRYIVQPSDIDGRTKEGKAWLAAVPAGVEVITAEQMETAQRQADADITRPLALFLGELVGEDRDEDQVVDAEHDFHDDQRHKCRPRSRIIQQRRKVEIHGDGSSLSPDGQTVM